MPTTIGIDGTCGVLLSCEQGAVNLIVGVDNAAYMQQRCCVALLAMQFLSAGGVVDQRERERGGGGREDERTRG